MSLAAVPQNLNVSQGNQQVYLAWDAQVGATSYQIQRSLDGVNYSNYATSTVNNYTDSTVALGTMYWYQAASVNASGTSGYSSQGQACPAPNGELSLYELRLRAQQRADRVESEFVTTTEWNYFIMQACYELYDLLIDVYEDYFMAPRARFVSTGSQFIYPLPNGSISFLDMNNNPFIAAPLYKLLGVDLGLNNANNAFVTMNKYNLIDRNNYVYPNTASAIYGVFNLRYRMLGTNIEFIPTPSANQPIQLLYAPRLPQLVKDTDLTTIGFSGWLQYVIIRAAKYALDKEESDTSKLDTEIVFLKGRIEESAMNRDAGQPDTISDVRQGGNWGNGGPMNGFKGGW